MVSKKSATRRRGRGRRDRTLLDRAVGGLALIMVHELGALSGHVTELRERAAVARRAGGVGELLRDQVDLLPETRARLRLDQLERSELLRAWVQDLRRPRAA